MLLGFTKAQHVALITVHSPYIRIEDFTVRSIILTQPTPFIITYGILIHLGINSTITFASDASSILP